MKSSRELAIVVKSYPFKEKDKVVVLLTENFGKITGIAKGAVNSKRFGGALDHFACSRISFIEKPTSDMVRIDEAVSHHEFSNIHKNIEALASASLGAEFILKLIEPQQPLRDLFVVYSHFLYQLDLGLKTEIALSAFWVKFMKILGYMPEVIECISCLKKFTEMPEQSLYWNIENGEILCSQCFVHSNSGRKTNKLDWGSVALAVKYLNTPFSQIGEKINLKGDRELIQLIKFLKDFSYQQFPNVPREGFASLKILEDGWKLRF